MEPPLRHWSPQIPTACSFETLYANINLSGKLLGERNRRGEVSLWERQQDFIPGSPRTCVDLFARTPSTISLLQTPGRDNGHRELPAAVVGRNM